MDSEPRREITREEMEAVNEYHNEHFPEIVPGEIWELEIGKFQVVTAGNKYVKLRRLK